MLAVSATFLLVWWSSASAVNSNFSGLGLPSQPPHVSPMFKHNLQGKPDGGYYVTALVGTPPVPFEVLIDTGSSNFAIAAYNDSSIDRFYDSSKSTTFANLHRAVDVSYTQGKWRGTLGRDYAALPNVYNKSLVVNLALIQSSSDFFVNDSGWQGILGLAYQTISRPNGDVEPFFSTLVADGSVNSSFSLLLCGPQYSSRSDDLPTGGTLTFGFVDHAQYSGQLYSAAIVREQFFEILLTDLKVNNESLSMPCTEYNTDKTIVDSGTTNLRLPSAVYKTLLASMRAKVTADLKLDDLFWSGDTHYCVGRNKSEELYAYFPLLGLDLMAIDYESVFTLDVSPQQYLRPVDPQIDPLIKLNEDCYKLAVSSSDTGTVLGAVVMEGFFVNFDLTQKSISFGNTTCSPRSALAPSQVHPYHSPRVAPYTCRFSPVPYALPAYGIALIVITCVLLVVILVFSINLLIKRRCYKYQQARHDIDITDLIQDSFDTEY